MHSNYDEILYMWPKYDVDQFVEYGDKVLGEDNMPFVVDSIIFCDDHYKLCDEDGAVKFSAPYKCYVKGIPFCCGECSNFCKDEASWNLGVCWFYFDGVNKTYRAVHEYDRACEDFVHRCE